MSTSLKELRDSISPEQRKTLKLMFYAVIALAVGNCWIWYLLFQRDNLFFLVFMLLYFYFCNIASNIRTLLMWPFYKQTDETE